MTLELSKTDTTFDFQFIKSRVTTSEAKHNPLYVRSATEALLGDVSTFLANLTPDQRIVAWKQLVRSSTADANQSSKLGSASSRESRSHRARAGAQKIARSIKNIFSRESSSFSLAEIIDQLKTTEQVTQLIFSDQIMREIGLSDASDQELQELHLSKEMISNGFLASMEDFIPDFQLFGADQNESSIVVNVDVFGLSSEVVLRHRVLTPISHRSNPFATASDQEFYKLAVLCKVHGLLEGEVFLAQLLRNMIKERSKQLPGVVPRFIKQLEVASLNLQDPALTIIKKIANDLLTQAIQKRRSFAGAVFNTTVAEQQVNTGRAVNFENARSHVTQALQAESKAGFQAHAVATALRRTLASVLDHLSIETSKTTEPQQVLQDILDYLRYSKHIKELQSMFVAGFIPAETEAAKGTDEYPIASYFKGAVESAFPDLLKFLADRIRVDDEVMFTTLVVLLIKYFNLNGDSQSVDGFDFVFDKYKETELKKKQHGSSFYLSEEQLEALKSDLATTDITFDPNNLHPYLSKESGVLSIRSKEVDELSRKLFTAIKPQSELDHDDGKWNKYDATFFGGIATLLVSTFVKLGLFLDVSQLSPEDVAILHHLLNGIVVASSYFTLKGYSTDLTNKLLPFSYKIDQMIQDLQQVQSLDQQQFTNTIKKGVFLLLGVALASTAIAEKDASLSKTIDQIQGVATSLVDGLDSNLGSEQEKTEYQLGNTLSESVGEAENRIFPVGLRGVTGNGMPVTFNNEDQLVVLDEQSPAFTTVDETAVIAAIELVTYQKGESIFELSDRENIQLVMGTVDANHAPRVIVEKTADMTEFPVIPGYVPSKVYHHPSDTVTVQDMQWSTFGGLTFTQQLAEKVYVIYERASLPDSVLQANSSENLYVNNVLTTGNEQPFAFDAEFDTDALRARAWEIIKSDPQLQYLVELNQRVAQLPTRQKLEAIQAELQARGMQNVSGSEVVEGNLENILELLRVDLTTQQLLHPNQICRGMSSMVFLPALLSGEDDIALWQVNSRPGHTSYGGNSGQDHLLIVFKTPEDSEKQGYWEIFEATLPPASGFSMETNYLPAENIAIIEAEKDARAAGPQVLTLTNILALALGVAATPSALRFARGRFFTPLVDGRRKKDGELMEIPSSKLTQLFKKLDAQEVQLLAHILRHTGTDGTLSGFWRDDFTPQSFASIQENLGAKGHVWEQQALAETAVASEITEVARAGLALLVDAVITDMLDGASDGSVKSKTNTDKKKIRAVLPELKNMTVYASDRGLRDRASFALTGNSGADSYNRYLDLLRNFSRCLNGYSREKLIYFIATNLSYEAHSNILKKLAKEEIAQQKDQKEYERLLRSDGDTRPLEKIVADRLLKKNNNFVEQAIATRIETKLMHVRQVLLSMSRMQT